ncbi:PAN domain-containing protein [Antarcticirhabdus aurantiaca]|uniref:PAN domain-containing protein n=1 Tax=Antarcticirhabdus aurantiaca TaxID=2606717 RepID=A0ACD4NQ04_9HYPH|nr:PAN domain-containing protein [Antarcticirhabdus aurantiaca]WAJ28912.1 PAN domain-containing protein [Jeongeuplla avenae]
MPSWSRRLIVAAMMLMCLPAQAVTIETMPMSDGPPVLVVQGEFVFEDDATSLVAKARETGASLVTFHSPGGNVDAAKRFGRMIRALGLSTLQIRQADCASACALAFLGGVNRFAQTGAIGVHQSSFAPTTGMSTADAVSAIQAGTADLMGYMAEMGVDPGLLQLSLTIDSGDMRYLTAAEMRQYRVTTGDNEEATASSWAPGTAAPSAPVAPGGGTAGPGAVEPPNVSASLSPPASSANDGDPARPDRMALYRGLDFVGRDIGMTSVADAPACALQCVSDTSCKAFTFNTMTPIGRGPNCFLKSSQGQLDGNSAAISGRLISRMEPDAITYSFGTIDPNTGIYRNVDIPGHDLSRRPQADVYTEFDCRLACVNEAACAAFTFVPQKKQCWLKAAVGRSRMMAGAVTGAKEAATFSPTHVDLE